jgi:hypothetical protein
VGKREIPGYLFRGEPAIYLSTVSARARLEQKFAHRKWEGHRQKLTALFMYCAEVLSRLLNNPDPHEVVGFLQHYGLPTATVDVTSSLDVAAFFGSYGAPGRVGLIAAFPVRHLNKHRRRLADLRGGRLGTRPDKQYAFVIFQQTGDDYKSDETCEKLGIKWYSFVLQESDQKVYHKGKTYLEKATDPFMGLLPLMVREFERDHGVFHPDIRAESLDKIPVIPLFLDEQARVVVKPKSSQQLFRIMNTRALAGMSVVREPDSSRYQFCLKKKN